MKLINAAVHDPIQMRTAGRDLLGLALMDARNRTLGWLSAFEGLSFSDALDGLDPPWWLAGQAAWFQEFWVARFVQRNRGERADRHAARLPSVDAQADSWFAPDVGDQAQRWRAQPPDLERLHGYLAATLDTTLALLDKAHEDDNSLWAYRRVLQHEDELGEALAVMVQALDLPPDRHRALVERGLWPSLPSRARRDAMWLPGQVVMLGSPPGGAVPEAERWAHPVQVPAFEIDAQPVSWAEFAEFVNDGGYDDRQWWTDAAWQSLTATGRRSPRYVEQTGGGVLARREGRLQRLPLAQPALHVSAHEAQAWCRWAGRRLPTEAEWLLAASTASARGFAWGDVLEWVAGSARALSADDAVAAAPTGLRVQRGASAWASPRLRHPQARRYRPAQADAQYVGFRSCVA